MKPGDWIHAYIECFYLYGVNTWPHVDPNYSFTEVLDYNEKLGWKSDALAYYYDVEGLFNGGE
jgi:hypothetical protein